MEALNLSGVEIKIVGVNEKGLGSISRLTSDPTAINFNAVVHLILELQFMMNFKLKVIEVDDYFPESYFVFNETNSSLAYQLITGKSDIAIGYLYHVLPRLKYGHPIIPFFTEEIHAFFQQPRNLMEQKNVYTKPYKLDVAIGTALILISMGILAEFSQSHRNIKPGLALLFFKVSRGFGWAVSTLSRQSYNHDWAIRLDYIKLMLFSGMLLSFALNSYYSAAILSYFTTDEEIIRKFAHLVPAGFSIDAFTSIRTTFPSDSENNTLINFRGVDYLTSVELVYEGNHAHLDNSDSFFEYSIQLGKTVGEICTVSRVHFNGRHLHSGFYCRFEFDHKEKFAIGSLKLHETGITGRYLRREAKAATITCTSRRRQYHDHLGLKEVWILFKFYIGAIIITFFLLIMEYHK
ncbi:hypothetical protein Fcan01_00670 [Folsomia candida]|uniref:Uncharacterized protein n=1 Tax=Folsomia candida TaxID=158441 RepID=A0A226F6H2_FOLCA|nr:hypothetical protein Fcan01_00670 [Folsomia candida]